MKTIRILIAFMAIATSLYAQRPKAISVGDSKQLAGAIAPLPAEQTYRMIMPTKLGYWTNQYTPAGFWASLPAIEDMKAKRTNANDADYTFSLVCAGIQGDYLSEPREFDKGGWLVDVNFRFPCKLEVRNKAGVLQKTFILNDGTTPMTVPIHPELTNEVPMSFKTLWIPARTGFIMSQQDAKKTVEQNREPILRRIEYNIFYDYVRQVNAIVAVGYGFPRFTRKPNIYTLAKKKDLESKPDLNLHIDQLSDLVTRYFSQNSPTELMSEFNESAQYFATLFNQAQTDDQKLLGGFNASMAFLLGGNNKESARLYRTLVNNSEIMLYGTESIFNDLFSTISLGNIFRSGSSDSTLAMEPYISISEQIRQEIKELKQSKAKALDDAAKEVSEAQAQAAYEAEYKARQEQLAREKELQAKNVNRAFGFIATSDGGGIKGVISLKFVEVSATGILDLDKGKLVFIGPNKSLRPSEVSYIEVENRRFEPAKPEGALINAIARVKLGGAGLRFMEVVHKKGDWTALIDLTEAPNEVYYIRKGSAEMVQSYNSLLKGGKEAKDLFGTCNTLLEKIDAKEFSLNRNDVQRFIDVLGECIE